jgi:hypothetical protein
MGNYAEIVQLLICAGAEANDRYPGFWPGTSYTLADVAKKKGRDDIVRLLIDSSSRTNASTTQDRFAERPLQDDKVAERMLQDDKVANRSMTKDEWKAKRRAARSLREGDIR